jgi:hypothetical protein
MIIIKGDSCSGKSTTAMIYCKEKKSKFVYFLMENDVRLKKKLSYEKFEWFMLSNGYVADIKSYVLEKGGINNSLDFIVIDCLNMIKDKIPYSNILDELNQIEKIFKIEIILIVNTLKNSNFDYLSKDNYDFINRELDSSTIFLQKEV